MEKEKMNTKTYDYDYDYNEGLDAFRPNSVYFILEKTSEVFKALYGEDFEKEEDECGWTERKKDTFEDVNDFLWNLFYRTFPDFSEEAFLKEEEAREEKAKVSFLVEFIGDRIQDEDLLSYCLKEKTEREERREKQRSRFKALGLL